MGLLGGRAAVVTGAGWGLGSQIAFSMAYQGARVVVNDSIPPENGKGAEYLVKEIKAKGGEAVLNTDVAASWEGSQHIIQAALDTFGRVDVLVNTADILNDQIIASISEEQWKTVLNAYLKSAFCCTRAAAPHMQKQKRGSLIHCISSAGLVGAIGKAHHGSATMAMVGFSRNVAIEMQRYAVTSNCIAHLTVPPLSCATSHDGEVQRKRRKQEDTITLSEVASLAVFLASDAASTISGQILGVRGKEIFLFSQPRIVRSIHHSQGWTVDGLTRMLEPAMKHYFTPLETSDSCFSWDPMV